MIQEFCELSNSPNSNITPFSETRQKRIDTVKIYIIIPMD